MRKVRECYLCGEKYSYCPSCFQDRYKPAWMADFHSESCKNIFKICTDFNFGSITKHEAQVALEQCDLSNKENFKSYVQLDLENIFAVEEQIAPVKAKNKSHEVVKQENE